MFPHYIPSVGGNDAGVESDRNGLIRSYYDHGFSYMDILLFLGLSHAPTCMRWELSFEVALVALCL